MLTKLWPTYIFTYHCHITEIFCLGLYHRSGLLQYHITDKYLPTDKSLCDIGDN